MNHDSPLSVKLPDEVLAARADIDVLKDDRDEFGQRNDTWSPMWRGLKAIFTTGVRGSVRDFGLRKDEHEHVRPRANVLLEGRLDVPFGARVTVTEDGRSLGQWRAVATEHRPLSPCTRLAVEQMDGRVRR